MMQLTMSPLYPRADMAYPRNSEKKREVIPMGMDLFGCEVELGAINLSILCSECEIIDPRPSRRRNGHIAS